MNFNKNCPSQLSSFCHFLPGKKPFFPQLQRALLKKELFPQPTDQEGTVKIDFSHSVVQECTVKKSFFFRVQLEHALLKKGFSPNVQALACTVKKEVFLFQCTALECTVKKKRFPPAYKLQSALLEHVSVIFNLMNLIYLKNTFQKSEKNYGKSFYNLLMKMFNSVWGSLIEKCWRRISCK